MPPRPEHEGTDPLQQEEWKKKLAQKVEKIQADHPEADVQLWGMDEHRVGLKPVIRDIWVNEWEPPIAKVNWRFKWLWIYAESPSRIWRHKRRGFYRLSISSYSTACWPTQAKYYGVGFQ